MTRFDHSHSPEPKPADSWSESLRDALHDVRIPADLQNRLLKNVVAVETGDPATLGLSRRRWISAGIATGIAAGVSGILAGAYAISRRPLTQLEVENAVTEAWQQINANPWPKESGPVPSQFAFPAKLRKDRRWQMCPTRISSQTVAFDISIPGCQALLFAIRTHRDKTAFGGKAPTKAVPLTGGNSNHITHVASWQDSTAGLLYVLALHGRDRDYSRLFTDGSATPVTG